MEEVDTFRSYLETERNNLPLLKLGQERALALSLRVLEEARIMYMGLHHTTNTRDAVTGLKDAMDYLIIWIYEQCESKPESDIPREIKIQRYQIAREALGFAKMYSTIMNMFDLVHNGLATLSVNEKIVRFQALHPYRELFEVQRADEATRWRQKLLDMYPNTIRECSPAVLPTDKYRLKYQYSKTCRKNVSTYIWSQMQQDWSTVNPNLIHYTTKAFKQVWHFLMVRAFLHRSVYDTYIRSTRDFFKFNSIIWFLKKDQLVAIIQQRYGLKSNIIRKILEDLIYDPTIKNNSLSLQPLVQIYNKYLILTPSLIIGNRKEATHLRLLARKYPELYSRYVGSKKSQFDKEIQQLFEKYGYLVCGKKLRDKTTGDTLTDIDAIAWKDSTIFIIQAKDFILPGTTRYLGKAEKEIKNAITQLKISLAYIDENFAEVIPELFPGFDKKRIAVTIFPFVVTRLFTGSRSHEGEFPIVDYYYIQNALNNENGNPTTLINRLETFLNLESFSKQFNVSEQPVKIGPYKVLIPMYERLEKSISDNEGDTYHLKYLIIV